MDDTIQRKRLDQASVFLLKEGIDAWMFVTSEGSDPALPLIAGVETVGIGVFIITKHGDRIAICSTIDAQDIVESDLFHEVRKYQGNAEAVLQQTVESLQLKRIALNYSERDPVADGLTVGRFRWLKQTLERFDKIRFESAEPIMNRLVAVQ